MEYCDPHWANIFESNHLGNFDAWWDLDLPTIDSGNFGRGGRSVVSRHVIRMPDGKKQTIYIKKQQNYTCSSWKSPFTGIPTFEREYINWKHLNRLGIGTYDLAYFAKRYQGKNVQAVLVSIELPAIDLVEYTENKVYRDAPGVFKQRRQIIFNTARMLKKMHDAGLKHGHLSPKHVFVGGLPNHMRMYLIDMELMHKIWWRYFAMLNDLSRFAKRMKEWKQTERMRFLLDYLGEPRLTPKVKRIWKAIGKKIK